MSYGYGARGGTPPGVPEVTVDQLEQAIAGGAPVIDVREPDEWAGGHIAGAAHIPMGEVVARGGEVQRGQPVYVICASGNRSGRAAQWYRSQGVDARNVAGGMNAWTARGKPVEGGGAG